MPKPDDKCRTCYLSGESCTDPFNQDYAGLTACLNRRTFSLGLMTVALMGCGELKDTGPIRVAVAPASPPNMFEANGKLVGLDIELFEAYCKARGRTMQVTSYDWEGMLAAVMGDKADVAFSAISITEKRKQVMDFSLPYMENTWNLVSLSDRNLQITELSQLKQYRIGYPRGMAYSDFIRTDLEPKGIYKLDQVKLYPSYNEVLTDLQNGNIDLAFLDGSVASAYRKKMPLRDSYIFSGFDRFGYAFPKGSTLREDFDRFLVEFGPQRRQVIIDKWIN